MPSQGTGIVWGIAVLLVDVICAEHSSAWDAPEEEVR